MRWLLAVILIAFLATAGSVLAGGVAGTLAHEHVRHELALSLPSSSGAADHCSAQHRGTDNEQKRCCNTAMCTGTGALEAQPSAIPVRPVAMAQNIAADVGLDGRDIPPEPGPPRTGA